MKNKSKIIALYDVKDEIGGETMEWLENVSLIRDEVGNDWSALNSLQKICLYWLMADICGDRWVRNFDCDSSEYVRNLFGLLPACTDAPFLISHMDTMTSAWSPIKKFLGLNMSKAGGARLLLSEDGYEYREELENIGAMDFLGVNHTIGNFMPVASYFNCYRTGFTGAPDYLASYDQGDLMLQAIYDYYCMRADDKKRGNGSCRDTDALVPLLGNMTQGQMETVMLSIKAWLDHFGTWKRFIEDNCLECMIEPGCKDNPRIIPGEPVKFFPGHSLEKPYPDNPEDWRNYFKISSELIENRSIALKRVFQDRSRNNDNEF